MKHRKDLPCGSESNPSNGQQVKERQGTAHHRTNTTLAGRLARGRGPLVINIGKESWERHLSTTGPAEPRLTTWRNNDAILNSTAIYRISVQDTHLCPWPTWGWHLENDKNEACSSFHS
ncbi:hypothetical protein J6590_052853 [Homalodisca vitripennis]|nr:hypothetical protein J6590_052853 [Homalodisca vitripennis]